MKTLLTHLQKAGLNGFFFALIFMVLLAWFFPYHGTTQSPLPLGTITKYGVSVIFLIYGLRLSPEKLRTGLTNWKLHLLIQTTTFLVFPLFVLIFSFLLNDPEYGMLWIGTFYLAALPSTVSSSVVMVSIAGGNLPAAIFNASISSVIGIFLTPLWMSFFIKETGSSVDLIDVIVKLCLQVLAPVILGILLHDRFGSFAERYKTELRYFDQTIILLIVYTAFCESFYGDMFASHQMTEILMLALIMISLFLVMFMCMYLLSSLFKFNREDTITVLFCGSKKSLVQGAVMGRVLFPNPVSFGLILLPLMLYHALQLIAGSIIAEKMAIKSKKAPLQA
jgi:sodium/bile acid cotransporter 7